MHKHSSQQQPLSQISIPSKSTLYATAIKQNSSSSHQHHHHVKSSSLTPTTPSTPSTPNSSLVLSVRPLSINHSELYNNSEILKELVKQSSLKFSDFQNISFSDLIICKLNWLREKKFFDHSNICELVDLISMPHLDSHFKYKTKIRFSNDDESSSGVIFDPLTCFFVSLENRTTLRNEVDFCKKEGKRVSDDRVYKIASQLMSTVHFMHMFGIFHSMLCPELICIADNGDIKVKDAFYYHLVVWINSSLQTPNVFMKESRDFELLVPYLAPELFSLACYEENYFQDVNNKCDVWSIGVILLEFILGNRIPFPTRLDTKDKKKEEWIESAMDIYLDIYDFVDYCKYRESIDESITEVVDSPDDVKYKNAWKRIQRLDKTLRDLLFHCLAFKPSERPDMDWLIEQPYFQTISKERLAHYSYRISKYPHMKCLSDEKSHHSTTTTITNKKEVSIPNATTISPLQERQTLFKQKYFEWKKFYDGKVSIFDMFYRRIFDMSIVPHFFRYNKNCPGDKLHMSYGSISQTHIDSYLLIPMIYLEEALLHIKMYNNQALGIRSDTPSSPTIETPPPPVDDRLYPSLVHVSGDIGKKRSLYNKESAMNGTNTWNRFSALITEKDMDFAYQQKRVHTFRKLLLSYPSSREEIIREAKIDIPSILRGEVWAAILGVEEDLEAEALYSKIIFDLQKQPLSNVTKRQIGVDVPRCHQYNPLLHSKIGHEKLRNVLEAWVYYHKNEGLVYWQGLDSLCAPLLVLNFDFEAKAFCCLKALVNKYTHDFFTSRANSTAMEERLSIFKKLHMYHDPEVASHLHHISFLPELYAISWFLTLFAHSLPIEKLFKLWDAVILGTPELPVFIAVAILKQMRNKILESDFNSAMYLFQNIQGIDMIQVLEDTRRIQEKSPNGLTCPKFFQSNHSFHISIDQYNTECFYPRITLEDFENSSLLSISYIVDIRPIENYNLDHYPSANHISTFLTSNDDNESNTQEEGEIPLFNSNQFQHYLTQLTSELNFKKGLAVVVMAHVDQTDQLLQLEHALMLESIPYVSIVLMSPPTNHQPSQMDHDQPVVVLVTSSDELV